MRLRKINLLLVSISIAVASCAREVDETSSKPAASEVQQANNGEGNQEMALTGKQSECVDRMKEELEKNDPAVESQVKWQLVYNLLTLRKIKCMTDPDAQRKALIELINSNDKLAGIAKENADTIIKTCDITGFPEKLVIRSAVLPVNTNDIKNVTLFHA